MEQQVNATALRDLLDGPLVMGTHRDITERFKALGLTETETDSSPSKARRVQVILAAQSDEELRRTAAAVLAAEPLEAEIRNKIQDVLWIDQGPQIWARTRRTLAAALDLEDLIADNGRFEAMLDRWWILGSSSPFGGSFSIDETSTLASFFGSASGTGNLRREIQQHVFTNHDWSTTRLFDELGAFDAVDRRFAGFVEDLVSHRVVPDEDAQRRIVAAMSPALREAGLQLQETGADSGYPVFKLIPTGATQRRPKNVIFGSPDKPDLRVSDTVDSEIEIVDARNLLVYDDPIGLPGLRWQDLQVWWQRKNPDLEAVEAKTALYQRLLTCLPKNSPPQQRLFRLYHHIHGKQIPSLPALLPEVWLHWDHKTVQERGVRALLGQRMDFLLLAPNHQRIVLEVDGVTHYTDDAGHPSPQRYGRNVRYDRELQLRGYSVYRFGGAELQDDNQAMPMLTQFFQAMFAKHGITG